jgi:hypothetical protein
MYIRYSVKDYVFAIFMRKFYYVCIEKYFYLKEGLSFVQLNGKQYYVENWSEWIGNIFVLI